MEREKKGNSYQHQRRPENIQFLKCKTFTLFVSRKSV